MLKRHQLFLAATTMLLTSTIAGQSAIAESPSQEQDSPTVTLLCPPGYDQKFSYPNDYTLQPKGTKQTITDAMTLRCVKSDEQKKGPDAIVVVMACPAGQYPQPVGPIRDGNKAGFVYRCGLFQK
jgi:hypothetical protein